MKAQTEKHKTSPTNIAAIALMRLLAACAVLRVKLFRQFKVQTLFEYFFERLVFHFEFKHL